MEGGCSEGCSEVVEGWRVLRGGWYGEMECHVYLTALLYVAVGVGRERSGCQCEGAAL